MKIISGKLAQVATIKLPHNATREFFHRGTPADLGVLQQMFGKQDYSLQRLRRCDELRSTFKSMAKPLIIDAGANIGASVLWFAMSFPKSHVIGFEPDAENFAFLSANTCGLDVDIRKAAIGSIDGHVTVTDPGEGEWSYRTFLDPAGDCELVSITRVIESASNQGYNPYIVKIDIEGGEQNLFAASTEWVEDLPILIIELHDKFMPKQRTSHNFLKCVAKYDRDFISIGENIFSLKN